MTASPPPLISDETAMGLALDAARRGLGLTAPNPPVGAVIVKNGRLLATGYHAKAGGPHAEIAALQAATAAGEDVAGATLYVTLEPCSTTGRTPPCTEAILAARLARVVWGATDPNALHAGRAAGLLRHAGLEIISGVGLEDCSKILQIGRAHV